MSPFVSPFIAGARTKEIVSNTFIMFSNISRQKRIPPRRNARGLFSQVRRQKRVKVRSIKPALQRRVSKATVMSMDGSETVERC